MPNFSRYAIFSVPKGAFYETGARWLGWDSAAGKALGQPEIAGLPESAEKLTQTPRKYGFHGTIKPPFRLTEGSTQHELDAALAAFCAVRPSIKIPRLAVRRIGGFVALVPGEPSEELSNLASAAVAGLDPFRAPPHEAELARRRQAGLSPEQERMLRYWGYPYVFDEFRFHLTLSGRLQADTADRLSAVLEAYFAPVLPEPYVLEDLCLLGEAPDGRFHQIKRYPLSG